MAKGKKDTEKSQVAPSLKKKHSSAGQDSPVVKVGKGTVKAKDTETPISKKKNEKAMGTTDNKKATPTKGQSKAKALKTAEGAESVDNTQVEEGKRVPDGIDTSVKVQDKENNAKKKSKKAPSEVQPQGTTSTNVSKELPKRKGGQAQKQENSQNVEETATETRDEEGKAKKRKKQQSESEAEVVQESANKKKKAKHDHVQPGEKVAIKDEPITDKITMTMLDRRAAAKDKKEEFKKKYPGVQVPRRPLTGYMYYRDDVIKSLREAHPDMKTADLWSLIAKQWMQLSVAERQRYLDKNKADSQRYQQEWNEFVVANPNIQIATPKTVLKSMQYGLPKKPLTAYQLYTQQQMKIIGSNLNHTKMNVTVHMKEIAKKWHALSPKVAQKWKDIAVEEQAKYEETVAGLPDDERERLLLLVTSLKSGTKRPVKAASLAVNTDVPLYMRDPQHYFMHRAKYLKAGNGAKGKPDAPSTEGDYKDVLADQAHQERFEFEVALMQTRFTQDQAKKYKGVYIWQYMSCDATWTDFPLEANAKLCKAVKP
eukprot:Ihof_evm18s20 gene=Ihof_evmTU18s20